MQERTFLWPISDYGDLPPTAPPNVFWPRLGSVKLGRLGGMGNVRVTGSSAIHGATQRSDDEPLATEYLKHVLEEIRGPDRRQHGEGLTIHVAADDRLALAAGRALGEDLHRQLRRPEEFGPEQAADRRGVVDDEAPGG